jgi:hypothetical protein
MESELKDKHSWWYVIIMIVFMSLVLAFGISGRSLAGPGVVYRGDWESGISYVGNQLRRDMVKYTNDGTNYSSFLSSNATIINRVPTHDSPTITPASPNSTTLTMLNIMYVFVFLIAKRN